MTKYLAHQSLLYHSEYRLPHAFKAGLHDTKKDLLIILIVCNNSKYMMLCIYRYRIQYIMKINNE